MINIFNSEVLLNPQMDYLYFLQNIRLSAPNALSDFFMSITTIGESLFSVTFMALIYWCINKKYGELIILSCSFGYVINQLMKIAFCIYRPWILDSRITPYDKAIPGAYGYSFPSGHTARVTLNFGGAALCFKSKIFKIFCLLIILLVAFSRNFLGVHSLQDVVIGFLVSIIIILSLKYFLEKVDLKNNKLIDIFFTVFMVVICFVVLYYMKFKNYPMDYVAGKLLVDPLKMQTGVFKASGLLIGCALGGFLERHYIDFEITQNTYKRIID
ncbi:phosphatase PAP2 family protein [bacterium]|nr:phosphatase PAP2 family protein [bacterium]